MATPVKVGFEFGLNSITANSQLTPVITALADGRYVAVWQDQLPPAGPGASPSYAARVQYFNANGTASGASFIAASITGPYTFAHTDELAVLGLKDGTVALSYTNDIEAGATLGKELTEKFISGSTITATNQLESQFVNSHNAGHTALAQLANGNVVTVWYGNGGSGPSTIRAEITSSTGALVSVQTVSTISADQVNPSVAALANGGFVVAWQDNGGDGSGTAVRMQRYDANGTALGVNTLVPAFTNFDQAHPVVAALPDGKYVVVYEDNSRGYSAGAITQIVARVFNADGTAVQGFLVHDGAVGTSTAPAVTVLPDGRFFIVWVDSPEASSEPLMAGTSIGGQMFKASGGSYVKDGSEILVNTYTNGDQLSPSVTTTIDGRILVTWQTASGVLDPDGTGISAQLFDPRESGQTFNSTLAAQQFVGTGSNDVIYANGDTVFIGGAGFDVVIEKNPGVTINVGTGTTLYQVEEVILAGGTNVVNGSYSPDFIYLYGGGAGSTNTMSLGSGGGYSISAGGTNHMFGGSAGTDVFIGGIGTSDMHGGSGNNVYYTGATDTVFGAGTYNTDVLLAPGVTLTNGGNITNVQQVILNGGVNSVDMTGSNDFVTLYGGAGTNTMKVGAGGGYMLSTGGINHMFGGTAGTDVFVGGIGTSDMHGGGGVNVYYVGANDTVAGAGAYNTLLAVAPNLTLTAATASNVQQFILDGGTNTVNASASTVPVIIIETQNASSDTMTGGAGNDTLLAYSNGTNVLKGGAGDDTLISYGSHTTYIFGPGSGHDYVDQFAHGIDVFDLSAYAAAGVHGFADLSITELTYYLVVQIGADSFSTWRVSAGQHLTASDFVFA